jgi:hypothetical protein
MNILNSLFDCSILLLEGILAFYFLAAFLPENTSAIDQIEVSPVEEILKIAAPIIVPTIDPLILLPETTVPTWKELVSIAKQNQVPRYSRLKKEALQQTLFDLGLYPRAQTA